MPLSLREKLERGGPAIGLWASIPSALTAEAAALAGPDYVVADQQHGALEPATLMAMLQLWAALHFRSFVPPLVLGILGTFIAVAAASAREGAYFPWLMPLHLLSSDPAMALTALRIGAYGGLLALAGMLLHLGRRESI